MVTFSVHSPLHVASVKTILGNGLSVRVNEHLLAHYALPTSFHVAAEQLPLGLHNCFLYCCLLSVHHTPSSLTVQIQ